MQWRFTGPLLVVPVIVATACGGGNNASQETAQAAATQEQATQPAAAAETESLQMEPKNDSGITGSATLTRDGDEITVSVSMPGLTSGKTYPLHIHSGTCAAEGPVVEPLEDITVTAEGTGLSTTTFPVEKLQGAAAGTAQQGGMAQADANASPGPQFFVQAHSPDGKPISCANLDVSKLGLSATQATPMSSSGQ